MAFEQVTYIDIPPEINARLDPVLRAQEETRRRETFESQLAASRQFADSFAGRSFAGSGVFPGSTFVYPGYAETEQYGQYQYILTGTKAQEFVNTYALLETPTQPYNSIGILPSGDTRLLNIPTPPKQGGFMGVLDDIFGGFGRVLTGVFTLGISEIPVSGRRLGEVTRLEPFVSTVTSGGIKATGTIGESEGFWFETGGKVGAGIAGVSAATAGTPFSLSGQLNRFAAPAVSSLPAAPTGLAVTGGAGSATPSSSGGLWETLKTTLGIGLATTVLGGLKGTGQQLVARESQGFLDDLLGNNQQPVSGAQWFSGGGSGGYSGVAGPTAATSSGSMLYVIIGGIVILAVWLFLRKR